MYGDLDELARIMPEPSIRSRQVSTAEIYWSLRLILPRKLVKSVEKKIAHPA